MLFRWIYDDDLAQGSFLIGCQAAGEAIVVDPRRDVDTYLHLADQHGLRISAVADTHIHADYQSGSRELAFRTGSPLYLSDEGEEPWKYRFECEKLRHGSEIRLGKVRLTALHTPSHTPEHLSFLVVDGATTDQPGILLSGDFVFVGDLGRPDLLDEAAGLVDTRFLGARQSYESLRDRFLPLPDHLQLWPTHGAGSACGKALGGVPPAPWATSGLPVGGPPCSGPRTRRASSPDCWRATDFPYFARMRRTNTEGPPLLGQRPPLRSFSASELRGRVNADLILMDTRQVEQHRADHVPGALFVPEGRKFATMASSALDPDTDPRPLVVLARDQAQANWMRDRLSWVGIDRVIGYVPDLDGLLAGPLPTVAPADLGQVAGALVLDVRTANEYRTGHLPGALQLDLGRVAFRSDLIPRDRPLVVHCQTGRRAPVAAAVLRARGFADVRELEGSFPAWVQAGKPVEVTEP